MVYGPVMASIEVRRGNDAAGYFRRIKITLDGATVVRLRPGKSATLTLPPGVHRLGGAMDWVTSGDFTVNAVPTTARFMSSPCRSPSTG